MSLGISLIPKQTHVSKCMMYFALGIMPDNAVRKTVETSFLWQQGRSGILSPHFLIVSIFWWFLTVHNIPYSFNISQGPLPLIARFTIAEQSMPPCTDSLPFKNTKHFTANTRQHKHGLYNRRNAECSLFIDSLNVRCSFNSLKAGTFTHWISVDHWLYECSYLIDSLNTRSLTTWKLDTIC